jgi:hypothetical protein
MLRENSNYFSPSGLIRSWSSARKKSSWRMKKVGRRPSKVYNIFGEARLLNISTKT